MRAKALQALALLLAAVSTGAGQIVGPSKVEVTPGQKNVTIDVKADADEAEYEVRGTLEVFREYSRDPGTLRLRIVGAQAGEEAYIFVAVVKDGKLVKPLFVCHVYVRGAKPPGPSPTPVPVPPDPKSPDPSPTPVPSDLLVKALRDAATKDGFHRVKFADVSDAFTALAVTSSRAETNVKLQDEVTAKVKQHVGELKTVAPSVRAVLQGALDPLDDVMRPGAKEASLTDEQRRQAKVVFERIAKAAMEAAR